MLCKGPRNAPADASILFINGLQLGKPFLKGWSHRLFSKADIYLIDVCFTEPSCGTCGASAPHKLSAAFVFFREDLDAFDTSF